MLNSTTPSIQTLDVRRFKTGNAAERAQFSKDLGHSFEEIGFVIISNHDISARQQKGAYEAIEKFFKLPSDTKRQYEVPNSGGARGYTTFGKEHAKDSKVGDLKEFFHVGMEVPAGHPLAGKYLPNVRVKEIPGFDETLWKLYNDLLSLGTDLLKAIALYLELPENYFDEKVRYGNSILRPIHYPPLTGKEEAGALRSSAHEDINLITLLIGASSPGLQVKSKQGEWISLTTQANEIAVNVGDMLQRLTNYKLVSTTHRVANPPPATGKKEDTRFSIPFFLHPVSAMSLAALPSCVGPNNPARDPSTTAGEYLDERLREIRLL